LSTGTFRTKIAAFFQRWIQPPKVDEEQPEGEADEAEEAPVDLFSRLQELIVIFEESGLTEIEIEESGHRMRLQKTPPQVVSQPFLPAPTSPFLMAEAQPVAQSPADEESDESEKMVTIDSPMVGTFYSAPAPGEPEFVKVGDKVEENQTVCIVEAMKLMNEVGAKFAGTIEKILVENGQPVEFGQALYAVRALD